MKPLTASNESTLSAGFTPAVFYSLENHKETWQRDLQLYTFFEQHPEYRNLSSPFKFSICKLKEISEFNPHRGILLWTLSQSFLFTISPPEYSLCIIRFMRNLCSHCHTYKTECALWMFWYIMHRARWSPIRKNLFHIQLSVSTSIFLNICWEKVPPLRIQLPPYRTSCSVFTLPKKTI